MDLSKEMLEQVYIPCIEISLTCVKYFTILCSGTLCDACIPTTWTYVQAVIASIFRRQATSNDCIIIETIGTDCTMCKHRMEFPRLAT